MEWVKLARSRKALLEGKSFPSEVKHKGIRGDEKERTERRKEIGSQIKERKGRSFAMDPT